MAMRKPVEAPPRNLRNGLKWRDGQPRWEPSPKSREIGIKGRDLKGPDGRWMSRGEAIGAADARQLWAGYIRDAHKDGQVGEDARRDLREALELLGDDETPQRDLVADLIMMARLLLKDDAPAMHAGPVEPDRTVAAMVAAYFAALEAREPYFCGEHGELNISESTRGNYRRVSKRLVRKFGDRRVDELTRGDMRAWYDELVRDISLSTANLNLGCSAAFFKWACLQVPPWLPESPCLRLGRSKAAGRRVFWEVEEETAFVVWCDANGFFEVADAVVFGIYTGARIHDLCAANLEDLAGDTWRYRPHKMQRRSKREALPGLTPQLRARIDRRRREAAAGKIKFASGTPFLWDRQRQARFDTDSLGERFREAKAAAIAAEAVPHTLVDKRGADWRDTCITRLWEAVSDFNRITSWTGHSPDEAAQILRDHYIHLRDAHARETLARLTDWMGRQGIGLSG